MLFRSYCQQQVDWQSAFIRDNFLVIGYFAWIGFQQVGAGALRCTVQLPPAEAELLFHNWVFTSKFLANQCLTNYFQTLPASFARLLVAVSSECNPQQEIMLILQAGESTEIFLLKSRAISPSAAYQMMLDRWHEFRLDETPFIISDCQQTPLLCNCKEFN